MLFTTTTTSVEDCNNLRHALPSIEDTWLTYWWEFRLFAFILAISDVNAFLIQLILWTVGYVRRECLRYWSFVGVDVEIFYNIYIGE